MHYLKSAEVPTKATSGCAFRFSIDEENPHRELRLGFDTPLRLLELVAGAVPRAHNGDHE